MTPLLKLTGKLIRPNSPDRALRLSGKSTLTRNLWLLGSPAGEITATLPSAVLLSAPTMTFTVLPT